MTGGSIRPKVGHPHGLKANDVVRCTSIFGAGPRFPLAKGHIYTVRAVEPGDHLNPSQQMAAPLIWLHGFAQGFAPFRFAKVADGTQPAPPAGIAVRMADVMRACEHATGGCTADDLARAGFSAAQIKEYADEARALAGPPSGLAAA
ncbi:hypothetical protein V5F77_20305 [Xanthobacter sp. DSM 24535]|uniref:hypothetical protein n=1 Tax=Roseixanthobacter psychrophilus TaxID=3119917 RepID=UPI00372685B0